VIDNKIVADGAATPRVLFNVSGVVARLRELGADSATENFVRNLITNGEIGFVRIGRSYYVSQNSIDAWLKSRELSSRERKSSR